MQLAFRHLSIRAQARALARARRYNERPAIPELGPEPGDPTPEQIEAHCELIRAGWSRSETQSRWKLARRERARLVEVSLAEI